MGICEIISACSQAGVSYFELGDMKIVFDIDKLSEISKTHGLDVDLPLAKLYDIEENEQGEDPKEIDSIMNTDYMIENQILFDPEGFEKEQIGG